MYLNIRSQSKESNINMNNKLQSMADTVARNSHEIWAVKKKAELELVGMNTVFVFDFKILCVFLINICYWYHWLMINHQVLIQISLQGKNYIFI